MMFDTLKTAIAAGHDTPAKFLEPVAASRGTVSRREIKIILMQRGKHAAVKAAIPDIWSDPDFDPINTADPLTLATLATLQAGEILSAADVAAITTTQVPRWQALGLPAAPTQLDLDYAASLP